jgi:predicted permease
MVVLFLIMLCGAIAYKVDILDDDSTKRLSGLILNFVSPAMIMSSVAAPPKVGSIADLGFIVLLIISFYVAAAVVGALMPWILRAPKEEHIIYNAMAVFSNVGFIGIPIIGVVLGTQYIIYGALFVFFNTIVVYSYGIYIFAKAAGRSGDNQINLRSMFINPGMIASFIALVIFMFGWQLPPFLGKTATMMGDMTGPLSMMVIGVSLAKANILDVVASPRLWIFAVLRLFAIPLLLCYMRLLHNSNPG